MTRAESPLKLTLGSKVGFNPAPTGFAANKGITAVQKVRGRDAASSKLIREGICGGKGQKYRAQVTVKLALAR